MTTRFVLLAAGLLCGGGLLAAPTIWNGAPVNFSKAAFADPTVPANQDALTSNVALTRGADHGLYNIRQEASWDLLLRTSPKDTAWAFQGLNGNPVSGVTAANFAALTFTDWESSLGGQFNLQTNIVGRPGVIHLITDDIYLDVTFNSWGGLNGGGAFSYTRSGDADTDGDGIPDSLDNCRTFPNPTQLDADADGYGNACDADLNNSGTVTAADFAILRSVLGQSATASPTAATADLNGSGTVTAADFAILRSALGKNPGPSGLHPNCPPTCP